MTDKYTVRNAAGDLLPPGTYFVIRASDVFAASGLWAYVHNMETVLELNAQRPFLEDDAAGRLRQTVTQAAELAKTWQASGLGTLPD